MNGAAWGELVLPRPFWRRPFQLDDSRRLRIDAKVERQLTASCRLQRLHNRAERRALQLSAHLPDHQKIREREIRIAVRAHDRPDQPPLLEVPEMILAQS